MCILMAHVLSTRSVYWYIIVIYVCGYDVRRSRLGNMSVFMDSFFVMFSLILMTRRLRPGWSHGRFQCDAVSDSGIRCLGVFCMELRNSLHMSISAWKCSRGTKIRSTYLVCTDGYLYIRARCQPTARYCWSTCQTENNIL
jgi:hypothetical protein